jgi:hypothetical protein
MSARWARCRRVAGSIVSHVAFDKAILVLILANCVMLALDNPLDSKQSRLQRVLATCDLVSVTFCGLGRCRPGSCICSLYLRRVRAVQSRLVDLRRLTFATQPSHLCAYPQPTLLRRALRVAAGPAQHLRGGNDVEDSVEGLRQGAEVVPPQRRTSSLLPHCVVTPTRVLADPRVV